MLSNAGGGGERVLWMAIKSLQSSFPKSRILIYCAPYLGVSDDEIVKRAEVPSKPFPKD